MKVVLTIADLPLAASSSEWYSEKAATIGTYAVASGIYTHLGHPPNITGSPIVTHSPSAALATWWVPSPVFEA